MSEQLQLPQGGGYPASLDCDTSLRMLVTEAMKRCPKKRAQIAEELSYLTGIAITEHMLNCYTAESKEKHRFPALLVPAFCQVTGDRRLLERLASLIGLTVIDGEDAQLLEYGRKTAAAERAQREAAAVKEQVLTRKVRS